MIRRNLRLAAVAIAVAAANTAQAQYAENPAPLVKAAMTKLDWLKGEWRGEGWRARPDGVTETFQVHESVEPRLDGLILIVEGRGWDFDANGARIDGHRAFGVFSYDAFAKTYRFDAFVKEGFQSRVAPEVDDGLYRWSHPAGRGAEMRYTAQLTSAGEWLETGERCAEETCVKTFEMRLSKTGADGDN